MQKNRLLSLDALRMLAAVIVFIQHFRLIYELRWPAWLTKGLFDSKAAVILFFVLSGYVLSISVKKSNFSLAGYLRFCIRRAFRLYPVYWASLIITYLVLNSVVRQEGGQVIGLPVEFLATPSAESRQWLLHTLLIAPGMNSEFVNPTVWTLMTEAKVSLIFPLLAWPILCTRRIVSYGLLAVLVFGSHWWGIYTAGTIAFLGTFALGCIQHRWALSNWEHKSNQWWIAFLSLGAALYASISLRYIMPSVWLGYYVCAIGSVIIVICSVHWIWLSSLLSKIQSQLKVELSYGVYITHYPIIVGVKKLAPSLINEYNPIAFVVSAILTTVSTLILNKLIEQPMINLGRRLTDKMTA